MGLYIGGILVRRVLLSRGSVSVCEGSGKYDKSSLQGSAGFYWGLEKGSTKIL